MSTGKQQTKTGPSFPQKHSRKDADLLVSSGTNVDEKNKSHWHISCQVYFEIRKSLIKTAYENRSTFSGFHVMLMRLECRLMRLQSRAGPHVHWRGHVKFILYLKARHLFPPLISWDDNAIAPPDTSLSSAHTHIAPSKHRKWPYPHPIPFTCTQKHCTSPPLVPIPEEYFMVMLC